MRPSLAETSLVSAILQATVDNPGGGTERIDALRESRDLYKAIADNAADWVYWRAPDGRLLYVSPSSERVTGYRKRDFEEDPNLLSAIIHRDDTVLFEDHLREEEGPRRDLPAFDHRIVTKDGHTRWINHACLPILDSAGVLLGRRVTNRDVTRRKQLEEEAQSLARFRSENPNPVLRMSRQGHLLPANAAASALMRTWSSDGGDALPESARATAAQCFTDGIQRTIELESQGRIYSFLIVPTPDASFVNMYGTDVTERRGAEDTLREARDDLDRQVRERTEELRKTNRLLRMISACDQALVGIDDEKELVQAICQIIQDEGGYRMAWVGLAENDSARRVRPVASAGSEDGYLELASVTWADTPRGRGPTGTAIRECRACIGRDFLTQPELAPWREEALRRGFRSSIALPLVSEGRAFGALTIYADQPGAFNAEQQSLLADLAGDLAFGILSVRARAQRDIAQKGLEKKSEQLRAVAAELVRVEEQERRRIGGILHDQLQQLLAGARFGLESLRMAAGAQSLRETVDKVDAMLRDCLDVSRSLTTELSPPVQYSAELESVMQWLAAWARERFGLRVTVQTRQGVRVDSEEIRVTLFRAVRELLFNVVKHAGVKEARVTIGPEEGDRVSVTVCDHGAGFDPAALRVRRGTSSGVGLFSLQERLEALGGSMRIESRPGAGSSFTIQVPAFGLLPAGQRDEPALRGETDAAAPGGSQAPGSPAGGKIRVLLVDDHVVVRQGLAMVLGGEPDIEIIGGASDGRSAVNLARALHPDAVTMDVSLPGMNGIEAARAIHAELPEVAVIGLSMFEDQAEAMLQAGAVGYLPKTGASSKLLALIRSVCRKSPT